MANERITEGIVRSHLHAHPCSGQLVEEQSSTVPAIRRLLSRASKSGTGVGHPEFIISFPESMPMVVIVVECKANRRFHESRNHDRPVEFAVDGVLHYSKFLSKSYDVIAIAVSGSDAKCLSVSTYRQLKGSLVAELLPSPSGPVERLIKVEKYLDLLTYDPVVRDRTEKELLAFSRTLHNYMRDYAKLAESEKPLVVSGILLALRDEVFKRNWSNYRSRDLARELYRAIERVAEDVDIPSRKREIMLAPYSFVRTHPELARMNNTNEIPLVRLISDIDAHVRPFLDQYHDVDVIGQFYGEFLRYTGGDKNLTLSDVVVDTCAGTGGFLISAMRDMDLKAGPDDGVRSRIRKEQLIGVEQQPHMFALAASNMILRGDGKANLYQGSCFSSEVIVPLTDGVPGKHGRPTVGLINPPYSQRGEGLHELDFVATLLDILSPGGTAVAVVPMSCAIEYHAAKDRILSSHTLLATMSLPNDLFHPVGVITCIMVFKAHQPHADAPQPTWFGYWKDDGFVKTKDRGRIDLNQKWVDIRDRWISAYHSRTVAPGASVSHRVVATDEWCAEAYMETDYSKISISSFQSTLRNFAVFRLTLENDDDGFEAGNDS
ncbi:HsdM family class I SAM-dependent methyltransferase [Antrihabitans spumae]|uniref:site-specific DNA-methyltransferase (adenine-specific) n=1 Tax=Antrihabitans spumae TaxID=3373370 RepID=A0ABW7K1L0_9NOCA